MDIAGENILLLIYTPLFLITIILELILSNFQNLRIYTLKETLTTAYISIINLVLDVGLRGFYFLVLGYLAQWSFFTITNPYIYWISLLFLVDFMFWCMHSVDHHVRLFWAVHVTHHSSQEFNVSVGFRSSVFQPLYRFIYFIPLVFLGFQPAHIFFMYSATQFYGILIHTQFVGKLGILDHIFATPSNHRVHHGANIPYLDRNMGMTFIIWDKIFGTYAEEIEPVIYGLTKPLDQPHHPVKIVFHEWEAMWHDVKHAPNLRAKLMYIFGPPGWSHDGSRLTSAQLRAKS
jgi:sterol desaturase/sphingolipid hydroxylase (fatty acid hydroxylase superfamily)